LPKSHTERLAEIEARGMAITEDELHEACRKAPRWSIDNADKLGDLIFAYGREQGLSGIPPECRESFIATLRRVPDQWLPSYVRFTSAEYLAYIEAKGLAITDADISMACRIISLDTKNEAAIRALVHEYANLPGYPEDIPPERRRHFVAALRQVTYKR